MNREELSRLYRTAGPVIYRRCLRLLGDRETAREATQEIFLRAVRHHKRLDPSDRDCLPWLYRVTTNYCLNIWRNRESRGAEFSFDEQLDLVHSACAEKRMIAIQNIAALLAPFDDQTRAIALYTHVDGMTQEEVAQVVGLSRRTVGTKLRAFFRQIEERNPQGGTA